MSVESAEGAMRYIRVRWLHDQIDEPVELFSELDDGHWELRKVEVFPDGRLGFADPRETSEFTRLSVEPLPSLEDIAADAQFIPEEISRANFEDVWNAAKHAGSPG